MDSEAWNEDAFILRPEEIAGGIIGAAPLLSSLSVKFTYSHIPVESTKLFGQHRLRQLEQLCLMGMEFSAKDFVKLMLRHSSNLHRIALFHIGLREGRWRRVFQIVRTYCDFGSIVFHCLVDSTETIRSSDDSLDAYVASDTETAYEDVRWDKMDLPSRVGETLPEILSEVEIREVLDNADFQEDSDDNNEVD